MTTENYEDDLNVPGSPFDQTGNDPVVDDLMDELGNAAKQSSKKKKLFVGFLIFALICAAILVVGRLLGSNNTNDGQEEVAAIEGDESVSPETMPEEELAGESSVPPTNTATPFPTSTPIPPTSTPVSPVQVEITAPQLIPMGLPQRVEFVIKSDAETNTEAEIIQFGGLMLDVSSTNEIVVGQSVNSATTWEINGFIDPQMSNGTFIFRFTANGVSEDVPVHWEAGDIPDVLLSHTVETIDGISSQSPGKTNTLNDSGNTYHLENTDLVISFNDIPDNWHVVASNQSIVIYLDSTNSEGESIVIGAYSSEEGADSESILSSLFDSNDDGTGGVTTYGELTAVGEMENTLVAGYAATYQHYEVADQKSSGVLEVVGSPAPLVVYISSSTEDVSNLLSQFNSSLSIAIDDANG